MKLFGLGHAMCDMFLTLPEHVPLPPPLCEGSVTHMSGEDMTNLLAQLDSVERVRMVGGTTVNILKIAAALGAECTFAGTTGTAAGNRDSAALFVQKELAKNGICAHLKSGTDTTGIFLKIQTATGGFALAASPAAAKQLTSDQIDENALADADFVVIEGMLSLNETVFAEVCRLCRLYRKTLFIDAASGFAAASLAQSLPDIADMPLILAANENESLVLQEQCALFSPPLSFERLSSFAPESAYPIIIEKKGKNGACAWMNGVSYEAPGSGKDAFDDTGAGDTFAGAFLVFWNKAFCTENAVDALQKSLEFANTAAASVLDSCGCTIPETSRAKLLSLL